MAASGQLSGLKRKRVGRKRTQSYRLFQSLAVNDDKVSVLLIARSDSNDSSSDTGHPGQIVRSGTVKGLWETAWDGTE